MMYQGMNRQTGKAVSDIEHIRQSISDILLTPVGTRIARREYGSLLSELIDQPQNEATKMQVMAASYTALSRWEPRITLNKITLTSTFDGQMVAEITGTRSDGSPANLSVTLGRALAWALSMLTLQVMADSGKAWSLLDGSGTIYGMFVIESISQNKSIFFQDGAARRIEFTITLKRIDESLVETLGDLTGQLGQLKSEASQTINEVLS